MISARWHSGKSKNYKESRQILHFSVIRNESTEEKLESNAQRIFTNENHSC